MTMFWKLLLSKLLFAGTMFATAAVGDLGGGDTGGGGEFDGGPDLGDGAADGALDGAADAAEGADSGDLEPGDGTPAAARQVQAPVEEKEATEFKGLVSQRMQGFKKEAPELAEVFTKHPGLQDKFEGIMRRDSAYREC